MYIINILSGDLFVYLTNNLFSTFSPQYRLQRDRSRELQDQFELTGGSTERQDVQCGLRCGERPQFRLE